MTVSSTIGRGARFKVNIPIDDPSKPIGSMKKISDWNLEANGQPGKK